MNNPIYVTRPAFPNKEAFDRLTDEIWKNQWLTNQGPLLLRFQEQLASYLGIGSQKISLMTNGHWALDAILKAMGLKGEVITTPFTFASTTHAIVMNGLKPVFCDIEPDFYTMDARRIEELITPETSAILPVHVYGHPCAADEIEQIAQKYHLKVIYDAAHAFGVRLNGKSLVEYGDASMLSFHATKLFHTIEGGMLYARDAEIIRKADLLKNFGIENEITVSCPGGNGKMNEFQAAMGILNLSEIERMIEERRRLSRLYQALLGDVNGIRFRLPKESGQLRYNHAYFPILVTDGFPLSRDGLYEYLTGFQIYARRYFYPLTSDYGCYAGRFDSAATPVADYVSRHVLALPIYNGLLEEDVAFICSRIKNAS